jgi:hypothetical protein
MYTHTDRHLRITIVFTENGYVIQVFKTKKITPLHSIRHVRFQQWRVQEDDYDPLGCDAA